MDPLAADLLAWYDQHRRRHLPWRERPGPYRTWVSEVMLQQTRVETVIPYFERFMARFPTVAELAAAPADEVLSMWSGLGYYSRARNMHAAAAQITALGAFPTDVAGLKALRGVGEYMAGAIGSIALGLDVPAVDGNVARVLARVHRFEGARRQLTALATSHLPRGRAGDFNQALMDLGATICTPRSPRCAICPVRARCAALRADDVSSFPVKRARRAPTRRAAAAALIARGDRVLLARRVRTGLFGGLYELPTVFAEAEPRAALTQALRRLGVQRDQLGASLGTVSHTLTHMHIDLHVFGALGEADAGPIEDDTYDSLRWVEPARLDELGVSILARRSLGLGARHRL